MNYCRIFKRSCCEWTKIPKFGYFVGILGFLLLVLFCKQIGIFINFLLISGYYDLNFGGKINDTYYYVIEPDMNNIYDVDIILNLLSQKKNFSHITCSLYTYPDFKSKIYQYFACSSVIFLTIVIFFVMVLLTVTMGIFGIVILSPIIGIGVGLLVIIAYLLDFCQIVKKNIKEEISLEEVKTQ